MTIPTISRLNRSAKQIIRKALPLEKANFSNTEKTSGADFLAADLSPSDSPVLFRIQVCISAAALFKAKVTTSGNAQVLTFNGGSDIAAGCVYHFDLLVHAGDTVNFQVDDNVTVQNFRVQEILWGVQ